MTVLSWQTMQKAPLPILNYWYFLGARGVNIAISVRSYQDGEEQLASIKEQLARGERERLQNKLR